MRVRIMGEFGGGLLRVVSILLYLLLGVPASRAVVYGPFSTGLQTASAPPNKAYCSNGGLITWDNAASALQNPSSSTFIQTSSNLGNGDQSQCVSGNFGTSWAAQGVNAPPNNGADITGYELEITGRKTGGRDIELQQVLLRCAGQVSGGGSNPTWRAWNQQLPGSSTAYSVGGAADDLGMEPCTPTDILASNTGFVFVARGTGGTGSGSRAQVSYYRAAVHWEVDTTISSVNPASVDSQTRTSVDITGGEFLNIPSADLKCRFGSLNTEVPGQIISRSTFRCTTPTLPLVTSQNIDLSVSLDGSAWTNAIQIEYTVAPVTTTTTTTTTTTSSTSSSTTSTTTSSSSTTSSSTVPSSTSTSTSTSGSTSSGSASSSGSGAATTTTTSTSSGSGTSGSGGAATATGGGAKEDEDESTGSGDNVGLIIGIIAGVCCCCILLVVAVLVIRRKDGDGDNKEASPASHEPDVDVVVYDNIDDIAMSSEEEEEDNPDGVVYADLNQFAELDHDNDDDVWSSSSEA